MKEMFYTDFIIQNLPEGSGELSPFYCRDVFSIFGSNNNDHQFIVKIAIDGGMGFWKVSAQILKVTDKKQGPPIILELENLKESTHNIHKLFEAPRLLKDYRELGAF